MPEVVRIESSHSHWHFRLAGFNELGEEGDIYPRSCALPPPPAIVLTGIPSLCMGIHSRISPWFESGVDGGRGGNGDTYNTTVVLALDFVKL